MSATTTAATTLSAIERVRAQWNEATAPLTLTLKDPSVNRERSAASNSICGEDGASKHASSSSAPPSNLRDAAEAAAAVGGDRGKQTADASHYRHLCRPWSRADFLDRVASFSIGTWFAKPAAIGVFPCARHGWFNANQPDLLQCKWCVTIASWFLLVVLVC